MRSLLFFVVMLLLVCACDKNEVDDLPDSTEDRPIQNGAVDTTDIDSVNLDSIPTDSIPTDSIPTDNIPTDSIPTDNIPTDSIPTDSIPAEVTDFTQPFTVVNSDGYALSYQQIAEGECRVLSSQSYAEFEGDIVIPAEIRVEERSFSVVTLADYIFRYCDKLRSVTIPHTIRVIGQNAFDGCTALAAINVEPGNDEYLSDQGVLYKTSTHSLMLYPPARTGEYEILEGTLRIRLRAFRSSAIKSVTIPSSVTMVGSFAFKASALESVVIESGNTQIEGWAFSYCKLKEVIDRSPQPQPCQYCTFDGLSAQATLYVPIGSKEAYLNAEGWNRFKNIVEIDEE